MKAKGAGVVADFIQRLFESRTKFRSEMRINQKNSPHSPNVAVRGHGVTEKEEKKYFLTDPYYNESFDENHVAFVFMNLNDLY